MRSLLLESDRKMVRREYRLRIFVVGIWFVTATGIFAILLMLPSYFLARAQYNSISEQAAFIEASRDESVDTSQVRVAQIQTKALRSNAARPLLSEVFRHVIHARPSGLSVTHFEYRTKDAKNSKEKGTELVIFGTAATRSTLLEFQKALTKETIFGDVDLPVSNLAKDVDIPFTLTLRGNF